MKIVITGASGLLGRYLLKTQPINSEIEGAIQPEYEITPCHRNNKIPNSMMLDVSDGSDVVYKLFKLQPDIIIHCAANGDVDDVEKNSSEAVKSDLLGTINLLDYCERMSCKLITISTNAVYDGDPSPYREGDKRRPVNFYGKIKSLADDLVEKSACDWIIIRPIFLYGWNHAHGRKNWATKIMASDKDLLLVDDSYTQPTYVGDVSCFIWKLIEEDRWKQTYNVSSSDKMTIYEFSLKVKSAFKLPLKISPVSSDYFSSIAPRPMNVTLYCQRPEFFSNVDEGLQRMKDEQVSQTKNK